MVREKISKQLSTPEIEGMNILQCQLEKDLTILVLEQPIVERHMRVKTVKLAEEAPMRENTSRTVFSPKGRALKRNTSLEAGPTSNI